MCSHLAYPKFTEPSLVLELSSEHGESSGIISVNLEELKKFGDLISLIKFVSHLELCLESKNAVALYCEDIGKRLSAGGVRSILSIKLADVFRLLSFESR